MISQIILLGILEGILLRDGRSSGPKVFMHFSYYHVVLLAYFLAHCHIFGWLWLPTYIIVQDFFSHFTEWLIDGGEFWSGWILWPFKESFGLPVVYWFLILTQSVLYVL